MCNFKKMSSSEDDSQDESDVDMTDSSAGSDGSESAAEAGPSGEGTAVGGDGEEEEEDEVVKAIRAEREKPREHPPNIVFEDLVVDISFHPCNDLIAAASITGDVLLYKYGLESNELKETWELHTKACRDIEFSEDGNILFSCAKDRCIMLTDVATGKLNRFYEDAHEKPLYSLYVFNDNVLCTGDEDGVVKVWDVRQQEAVASFKKMEDFVSDMVTTDSKKYLVCSSGDGSLSTFDMVASRPFLQSEEYDAELNCLALFRRETKLLVGSSKGRMYLFNWEEFGYHSDEYPGTKQAVNAMVPVTDNIVVVGTDDGLIRAANLFPYRQFGIVGQHDFSVEAMDISHDGSFIASCALDQTLKFWPIRYFEDLHADCKKVKDKKRDLANNLPSSKSRNSSDFFSGLA